MQEPWSAPLREAAEPSSSCWDAKMHTQPTFLTAQTYVLLPVQATLGRAMAHFLWAKSAWLAMCREPWCTVVLLLEPHSMQKEAHEVRTYTPLCQRTSTSKVNAACLCTGVPVTDGAQVPLDRQTMASLGHAIGKWRMLPSPEPIFGAR